VGAFVPAFLKAGGKIRRPWGGLLSSSATARIMLPALCISIVHVNMIIGRGRDYDSFFAGQAAVLGILVIMVVQLGQRDMPFFTDAGQSLPAFGH
jgi:hypothetical protein